MRKKVCWRNASEIAGLKGSFVEFFVARDELIKKVSLMMVSANTVALTKPDKFTFAEMKTIFTLSFNGSFWKPFTDEPSVCSTFSYSRRNS